MIRLLPISIFLFGFTLVATAQEEAPSVPMLPTDEKNSLSELLKGELLHRYQEALAKDKNQEPSHRRSRPRPELGKGRTQDEPIDISKYIGTEGDPEKTMDKLRELGKIPPPQSADNPPNATDSNTDIWPTISKEKRLDYAQALFDRRKYEEAQRELEQVLATQPKEEEQFQALLLREKCLFHRRFYDTVEDDYYRLKSYFPKKEKPIDEMKTYLEEKSGIADLQKKVFGNPLDPVSQQNLLNQYKKMNWLDFAEEFFLDTIKDTSPITAKSLCEIYFQKNDFEMLVTLSRAAHELHPGETAFLYNEGVGLYQLGDPASRRKALELFQKVLLQASAPHLQKNAQWYIDQLTSSNP